MELMEPLQIREPKFDTSSFKSILSRATTCFAFCQPEPVIPTSMQGAFRHGTVNLFQQNVGFGWWGHPCPTKSSEHHGMPWDAMGQPRTTTSAAGFGPSLLLFP